MTRRGRCGGCAGEGRLPAPGVPCRGCSGTGTVRTARGHMVFRKACTRCEGTGAANFAACPACGGAGVAMRTESVAVAVPAGVQDGERLRLAGEGNAGARGAAPGDLYVTVHVEPDPRFRREGDDLHIDVPLAIHEAALRGPHRRAVAGRPVPAAGAAGHAVGPAVPASASAACRRRGRAGPAISWRRCGWCSRRSTTNTRAR